MVGFPTQPSDVTYLYVSPTAIFKVPTVGHSCSELAGTFALPCSHRLVCQRDVGELLCTHRHVAQGHHAMSRPSAQTWDVTSKEPILPMEQPVGGT